MAGLVPAIHAAPPAKTLGKQIPLFLQGLEADLRFGTWMPGTSPGMTAAAVPRIKVIAT
jgi:hypothetical protein